MDQGRGEQFALLHHPAAGQRQSHKSARDGCGPGAAVALQYVAVHCDQMFAQTLQIDSRTEGTPDQALNLRAAGGEFQTGNVARLAIPVGARQHIILRRDPAFAARDIDRRAVLHARTAQDDGVSALDQTASLRETRKICGNFDRPQFVDSPSVFPLHSDSPFHLIGFSPSISSAVPTARNGAVPQFSLYHKGRGGICQIFIMPKRKHFHRRLKQILTNW